MSDDQRDPIIDSLLDEVLGDKNPPDLTQRILGAHRAITESLGDELNQSSNGKENQPRIVVESSTKSSPHRNPARPSRQYNGWATVAVVLIGAGLFTTWALNQQAQFHQANQPNFSRIQAPENPKPEDDSKPDRALAREESGDMYQGQEETTVNPGWWDPAIVKQRMLAGRKAARKLPFPEEPSTIDAGEIETPKFRRLAEASEPSTDAQVVRTIDNHLKEGWKRAGVTATKSVGDMAWFNRATYALLGRESTLQERKIFAANRDREEATSELLARQEFSRHWANQFTDVLVGAATSKQFDRLALQTFLADSIEQKKPLDQLAFELITAQGGGKSDLSSHNPAVNFLLAYQTSAPSKVAATDKVCQVFLGKQMQCVRCHDHPTNKKTEQKTYWEVAAYFTQMQAENNGLVLVDRDYGGSKGVSPDDADLFFDTPSAGATAYPSFAGSEEIKSGRIDEVNRRVELANSIVSCDDFARASINRMWRQIFRSGFTTPVDDMGSHNKPFQEELLNDLASQFKRSEYDVRAALRWMLRSAAFNRQVRPKNDPLIARTGSDAFSSFARRDSVIYQAIDKPLVQLAKAHTESRTFDPTSLLGNVGTSKKLTSKEAARELQIVNGKHRQRLLNTKAGSMLQRLVKSRKLEKKELVEHLFFSFVGRAPTDIEMKSGLAIVGEDRPKLDDLIEISQIILNSNEFKTQH